MAFSPFRFTENAAGMTGRAAFALYDGRGNAGARTNPPQNPDQGGDELADIKATNFFDHQVVRDAIREAVKGDRDRTAGGTGLVMDLGVGGGLPIMLMGNDGTEFDTVYVDGSDDVVLRGGGFNVT